MKFLIILITALGISQSWAQSSEMLYQQEAGETVIEGGLVYRALNVDGGSITNMGTTISVPDAELRDTALNLKVSRGFTEDFSGYATFSFGDGEITQAGGGSEFKGLDLIHLGGLYQQRSKESRIVGLFDFGIGLEDAKGDNRTSSQIVLTLGLGYEKYLGDATLGGLFSYGLVATDFKNESGAEAPANGNLDLKLYYEKSIGESSMGPMVFGGQLAYQNTGGSYWQGSHIDSSTGDFSSIVLGGYTRIPMMDQLDMIAGLDYRISTSTPSSTDSVDGYELRLGGRMTF